MFQQKDGLFYQIAAYSSTVLIVTTFTKIVGNMPGIMRDLVGRIREQINIPYYGQWWGFQILGRDNREVVFLKPTISLKKLN